MTKVLITSGDYLIAPGGNLFVTSNINVSGILISANNIALAGNITSNNASANVLSVNGATVFGPTANFTGISGNININLAASSVSYIQLVGNVTTATVTNGLDGRKYIFVIQQPSSGNCAFPFPSNFNMAGNISHANFNVSSNSICTQEFLYLGAANIFIATTPLLYNGV